MGHYVALNFTSNKNSTLQFLHHYSVYFSNRLSESVGRFLLLYCMPLLNETLCAEARPLQPGLTKLNIN